MFLWLLSTSVGRFWVTALKITIPKFYPFIIQGPEGIKAS
jgi:hypothetical protein